MVLVSDDLRACLTLLGRYCALFRAKNTKCRDLLDLGVYRTIITVFQRLLRWPKAWNGVTKMVTVREGIYRCGRICNGATSSAQMPKGLGRCFRVWNGGGDTSAVFYGYDTVTGPVMLPKSLRHRYRACNFKDFRTCLTDLPNCGAGC
jgi:hypothetical protein